MVSILIISVFRRLIVFGENVFVLNSFSVDELDSESDKHFFILYKEYYCYFYYNKKILLFVLYPFLLGMLSFPASLLDFKPDDDEYESISLFLAGKLLIDDDEVSVLETQGFVRILQRCLGDGAGNI